MLVSNHESQMTATPDGATGGVTLHLVFSSLTAVLLTLAVDAFAGGLGTGALLVVALVIASPLALLAVALGDAREPRG
ncbi:MAG: hypothetical protein Q8R63_02005 [Ramlibacter sp.]|nr:hypothetical protein [Ramlibacter sp.]